MFARWFQRRCPCRSIHAGRRSRPFRPEFEALEDRQLLTAVTDLGALGHYGSFAMAINQAGQVTGDSTPTGYYVDHAFLYRDGAMEDLGALGGDSAGSAINDNGLVAGNVEVPPGNAEHAAILNGGVQDLGTLGDTEGFSYGNGINDNNIVVGTSELVDSTLFHAVFWDGTIHDLGTLGGEESVAFGINNSNQIVGWSQTASYDLHAFLYDSSGMHDLQTLDSSLASVAIAINASGQVTGYILHPEGTETAFICQNGQMIELGGPNTEGHAINDFGQVVGFAWPGLGSNSLPLSFEEVGNSARWYFADARAFLYSDGAMIDLNSLLPADSGWTLLDANGINDNGQIVGYGINPEGEIHAFLLQLDAQPATLINFEDGAALGGMEIGDAYQALGVTFSNAIWITPSFLGPDIDPSEFFAGQAGLGVANGVQDPNPWAFPGTDSPIVISFSSPMSTVSIDVFDVGVNGAGLEAYDAAGNLIATDQVQGVGAGFYNNATLTVTGVGIQSVHLDQPWYSGYPDGIGWDNLRFSSGYSPRPPGPPAPPTGSQGHVPTRGDASHASLVTAVSGNALPRSPLSSELAAFGQLPAADDSLTRLAEAVFSSTEYQRSFVESLQPHYSSGGADPVGLDGFVRALQRRLHDEAVIADPLGPDEYLGRF